MQNLEANFMKNTSNHVDGDLEEDKLLSDSSLEDD
jgi:hypothetical protein